MTDNDGYFTIGATPVISKTAKPTSYKMAKKVGTSILTSGSNETETFGMPGEWDKMIVLGVLVIINIYFVKKIFV